MAGTGSSKQVDPIAYRVEEQQQVETPVTEQSTNWQFDASKLKNADVNLSKYGDDSSEANYNNPDLWGGENDKYKGENTRNTSVAYDKNATLENLNPNYAYGQKAQMVNSSDAGYIQRRNDQIASALYNAGKTSIQDVSDYLNQQTGFQNSTQNERNNTIASVWKRLGEIQGNNSSNGSQNENKTDTTNKAENDSAVKNMERDLLKSTAGELYGKNTADVNGDDSAIKTLQDTYNVERAVNEQRIRNMKTLQSMSSDSIAASYVAAGVYPGGEQAMRDLMQYDSAKYNEVQQKIKEMKAQININSITKDGTVDESGIIEQEIKGQDADLETWAKNNSDSSGNYESLIEELQGKIDDNNTAKTAREQMSDLSNQIKGIQQKMKNLKRDAPKMFKSDVPQYIVNAYIANKTLEYQDQIQTLNGQLQTATAMRSNEIEEIKLQMSMQQFELSKQNQAFNQWATKQNLNLSFAKFENDKLMNSLIKNDDGTYSQIQFDDDGKAYFSTIGGVSLDGEIYGNSDNAVLQGLAAFCSANPLGSNGGQCGSFVNDYLQSLGLGRLFGNEIAQKDSVVNRRPEDGYVPQVGDIVVMDSPSKPQYGHVAIVTAVNGNEITTIESNKTGAGEVFTRTFVPSKTKNNSNYVYGYYHPEISGSDLGGQGFVRIDGTKLMGDSSDYDKLNDADKKTVLSLINLQLDPSKITKRGNGYNVQAIKNAAASLDPEWDETRFSNKMKVRQAWSKDLTTGNKSRSATAVTSAKDVVDFIDEGKIPYRNKLKTVNDLLNATESELNNPALEALKVKLKILADEGAGALKGGSASLSEYDSRTMDALFNTSLNGEALKSGIEAFVKGLFDKNETEAMEYYNATYEKPKPIWVEADWMQTIDGIDLTRNYNYSAAKDPFDSLDS